MRPIDADSLIRLVNDATILSDGFKQAFVALVKGEPTIEPERKTGRWIGEKGDIVLVKNGYTEKSCSCSECGEWLVGSDEYACCGNYCPNCGSPMEVEHEV